MTFNLNANDLIHLSEYGGGALAVSLFIVLIALWRGWLELGPAARREVGFWQQYAEEMRRERDGYKGQVEERQSVVDQAIELGQLLREYADSAMQDRRGRGNTG